jgi:hypothetical protein
MPGCGPAVRRRQKCASLPLPCAEFPVDRSGFPGSSILYVPRNFYRPVTRRERAGFSALRCLAMAPRSLIWPDETPSRGAVPIGSVDRVFGLSHSWVLIFGRERQRQRRANPDGGSIYAYAGAKCCRYPLIPRAVAPRTPLLQCRKASVKKAFKRFPASRNWARRKGRDTIREAEGRT